MELVTFIPQRERSIIPTINNVVKKFHFLVANYSVEIGNYSIVPKRTIFGNPSRTKKVIQWNKGLALGVKECVCGFISTETDIRIMFNGEIYYTNVAANHKMMFHYDEVPIENINLINSFNIELPEKYEILDDQCSISSEKYNQLFHASIKGIEWL